MLTKGDHMDRFVKTYIILSSLVMACAPWLAVGIIVGTEEIPVWISVLAFVVSLLGILGGIMVDFSLKDEQEYNENAIRILQDSRSNLLEELANPTEVTR